MSESVDVVVIGMEPGGEAVARRIREQATDNWNDQVAVGRFTGKDGRFVRGIGRITGPGRCGGVHRRPRS